MTIAIFIIEAVCKIKTELVPLGVGAMKLRYCLLGTFSILLFLLAGSTAEPDTEWSVNGNDDQFSYSSSVRGDIFYDYYESNEVFTSKSKLIGQLTSVDIDNDKRKDVVAITEGNIIYIVSGENGEILFQHASLEEVQMRPRIVDLDNDGDFQIIIPGLSGNMTCIDISTNKTVWKFRADSYLSEIGRILTIPSSTNDTSNIMFPDEEGTIYQLTYDGYLIWKTDFELKYPREICMENTDTGNRLFSMTKTRISYFPPDRRISSELSEISLENGNEMDNFSLEYDIYRDNFYSNPSFFRDASDRPYLLIGGKNGYLFDISKWTLDRVIELRDGRVASAPIIIDDNLYLVFLGLDILSCWNSSSQELAWTRSCSDHFGEEFLFFDIDGDIRAELIIAKDDYIDIMDPRNGSFEHRVQFDDAYRWNKWVSIICSDLDGDDCNELVFRAKLDSWKILYLNTRSIGLNFNTTLSSTGNKIYPEIPVTLGYEITEIPSWSMDFSGTLYLDDQGFLPTIDFNISGFSLTEQDPRIQISNLTRTDGPHSISLWFQLLIGWDVPHEEPITSSLQFQYTNHHRTDISLSDIFSFENDLEFFGELDVKDSDGDPIQNGAWTNGTSQINLMGGPVVFEGSDISPDNSNYMVVMTLCGTEIGLVLSTDGMFTHSIDPSHYDNNSITLRIGIENITYNGTSGSYYDYFIRIDRTPPEIRYRNENDDDWWTFRDVTVGFEIFDNESGLNPSEILLKINLADGSHFNVEDLEAVLINDHHIRVTSTWEFQEGSNEIQIIGADLVGNRNDSAFYVVMVDTTNIKFVDFSPTGWQNSTDVTVSVNITDLGGSGINHTTLSYSISNDGIFSYGEWTSLGLSEGVSPFIRYEMLVRVPQGSDNFIRFKGRDVAGNEYQLSEDYRLLVDTESPNVSMEIESLNRLENNISIIIEDNLSGVSIDTLSITILSNDIGIPFNQTNTYNGTAWRIDINLQFTSYRGNTVIVNISDRASNTRAYVVPIIINSPPNVIITSPREKASFYNDDEIVFHANVTDIDDDQITIRWEYENGSLLSSEASFSRALPPGKYSIRCIVDDQHEHVVSASVDFNVRTDESPDDPDLLITSREAILILIIIVCINILVAIYLKYRNVEK